MAILPRNLNVIRFGHYVQDEADADPKPIEWIVLDKTGEEALLISKYILDSFPIDKGTDLKSYQYSWPNSELRKWLNSKFKKIAFNNKEKKMIVPTDLITESYNGTETLYQATSDDVFLMTVRELKQYFKKTAYLLSGKSTKYARHNMEPIGTLHWVNSYWTRSKAVPNEHHWMTLVGDIFCVDNDGSIKCMAFNSFLGIRPALHINLELWCKENKVDIKQIVPAKTKNALKDIAIQIQEEYLGLKTVLFGNYYQDVTDKAKKPIEWFVLKEQDGKALLLSKKILDCKPYSTKDLWEGIPDWKHAGLNEWLNNEFLNETFSTEEQEAIILSDVAEVGSADGRDLLNYSSTARLFLMSFGEISSILRNAEDRMAAGTAYAAAKYAKSGIFMPWYLRTCPASGGKDYLSFVYPKIVGGIDQKGFMLPYVKTNLDCGVGIRPAMWVTSSAVQ